MPLPTVGQFVLVRGGERLFARPDPSAPSITLPSSKPPFMGPIAAAAVAVRDGFVEVEMQGEAARVHCGDSGYADHLRGFVRADSLLDVTSRRTQATFDDYDVLDVPEGIAVDRSGSKTVLEFGRERLVAPIEDAAIGRSYVTPPMRRASECLEGNVVHALVEEGAEYVDARFDDDDDPDRPPVVVLDVYFESGEALGKLAVPRQRDVGTSHARDPARRCIGFSIVSGVSKDARVCFDAAALEEATRPPPPPRLKHVDIPEPRVRGRIDAGVIGRIVDAHAKEVLHCYGVRLERDPELTGNVTVSFFIEADGKVRRADVQSATMPDDGVNACVVQAVRRWTFPKPAGGKEVHVLQEFRLWSEPMDGPPPPR